MWVTGFCLRGGGESHRSVIYSCCFNSSSNILQYKFTPERKTLNVCLHYANIVACGDGGLYHRHTFTFRFTSLVTNLALLRYSESSSCC